MRQELFQEIEKFIPACNGWASVEKCKFLAQMILENKPRVVVLVGVYAGRDLIAMAMACRENGQGIVTGVDPWSAAESVKGQPKEHAEWWGKDDHEAIYQECLANIKKFRLENFVNIVRKRSDDYYPPSKIDLLILDGNHGRQVISDVTRYATRVHCGGYALLDDLNWEGGHVQQAVDMLIGMGSQLDKKVKNDSEDWAVFKKIK